ncbi:MAG TPA: hypothetical protein VLC74_10610 [Rhizomicrobium sp.]|nr:hypothetical protein [Rhizomicrobium sp.]
MGKLLFQRTEFRPGSEWTIGKDHLLRFNLNGNLEFWQISRRSLIWETATQGDRLMMQGDGNLVIYDGEVPVWSSGTFGNPDAVLAADEEGHLEILTSDLELVLWQIEADEPEELEEDLAPEKEPVCEVSET